MTTGSETWYRASAAAMPGWPAFEGRREARVCVVGGGFAGLATALGLAERGIGDVVVLEAREIAHGASGRNGGFAFGGFSRGEDVLLRELGRERARALYRGTLDAVALMRRRIGRYRIDCDANEAGVLWVNWFRDPEVLRSRQRLLSEHFGVDWEWVPAAQARELVVSDRYHDALWERDAFHLHPLNYALGSAGAAAAQGVAVHEHSPATALARDGAGWRVATPAGELRCETVVLACGGYLAGLDPRIDAGVLPIATYVMVTEPLGSRMQTILRTDAAVYDTRFAFDYYRPLPDSRLLWGGRISMLDRGPRDVQRLLRRDLLRVFPQLGEVRIDYAWSGLMGYSRHQMPQVGQLEPGLWMVQAFGGHGVAPTTFGGELAAAAIAEGDTRWRELGDYGLVSTFKPLGLLGAQARYWWLQARDAAKDLLERATG